MPKYYKNFGNMISNFMSKQQQPQQHPQQHPQQRYQQQQHTNIMDLPPAQDVPKAVQSAEYFRETDSMINPSKAIRNFRRPSAFQQQEMPPQQQQQQMQVPPQYQQMMPQNPYGYPGWGYPPPQQQQQQQMMPPPMMFQGPPPQPYYMPPPVQEKICKRIGPHLKACADCRRKYTSGSNTYISIIVVLILIIFFLVTKVLDKK